MDKYFYYYSDEEVPFVELRNILLKSFPHYISINQITKKSGVIISDISFLNRIENLLPLIVSDFGISLTILVSHEESDLALKALKKASTLRIGKVTNLGDLLMELVVRGDTSLNKEVEKEFALVPEDLIKTASMFLDCGLNGVQASKNLYVHRNTFNYRLSKFIDMTSLDIRDYHKAWDFSLFLKIRSISD